MHVLGLSVVHQDLFLRSDMEGVRKHTTTTSAVPRLVSALLMCLPWVSARKVQAMHVPGLSVMHQDLSLRHVWQVNGDGGR